MRYPTGILPPCFPRLKEHLAPAPIWLGITSLLLFFLAYLLVLSWADYSYVQPASATGYFFVALLGYLLLGEVIPRMRWVGVLVICVGVLLVGGTPPRTTEQG